MEYTQSKNDLQGVGGQTPSTSKKETSGFGFVVGTGWGVEGNRAHVDVLVAKERLATDPVFGIIVRWDRIFEATVNITCYTTKYSTSTYISGPREILEIIASSPELIEKGFTEENGVLISKKAVELKKDIWFVTSDLKNRKEVKEWLESIAKAISAELLKNDSKILRLAGVKAHD